MKKINLKRSYVIIVLIISFITLFIMLTKDVDKELKNRGDKIISEIEEYKRIEGHIPGEYNQLNIEEIVTTGIFYQKIDSVNYILWFGTSLGESKIYYSDSKRWENGYREIKD